MLVSEISNKKIYKLLPAKGKKEVEAEDNRAKLIGKGHFAVCAPGGRQVVGFLIKRKDVAGMFKQDDVFVALDGLVAYEDGFAFEPKNEAGEPNFGDAAQKRVAPEWDLCIMWTGMDAKTLSGRELGWVGDIEFDPTNCKVTAFHVGDGSVAQSLVGHLKIDISQLLGYDKGYMIVKNDVDSFELSGGAAAKAGEAVAKAQEKIAPAVDKAVDATANAVETGGKALGKQLGKTKGMFSNFMDEYKKASK